MLVRPAIVVILCLIFLAVFGESALATATKFKTVGYLPDYDTNQIEYTINFKQLTDVNYFALIPQADGKLEFTGSGSSEQLEKLVKLAHENKVSVGVSIGGWGLSDYFVSATNEENRSTFIDNINKTVKKYQLDTVDIDWEYPEEGKAKQFETFIKELKVALGETNLSICVPTGVGANGKATDRWEKHFTPKSLKTADWVNIMSYDAQVPGFPNHSPIELQKNSLNYWNEVMGGDQMDKLVGGVPFYAKAEDGAVMTYGNIVRQFSGVPTTETVFLNDRDYYINNKEIIQEKTEDTIELGALGVMIWAPTQDAELKNPSRLMNVIVQTVEKSGLVLDETSFGLSNVEEQAKKAVNVILIVIIIALVVVALGMLKGYFLLLVPQKIKGRKVNKRKIGRVFALLLFILAFILLLFLLLPFYLVIGLLVLFIIGGYFLLR